MPVKRRSAKRLSAVSEHEAAWLRGDDSDCSFVKFRQTAALQELWDRAGDSESFFWEPGMRQPEPIETE